MKQLTLFSFGYHGWGPWTGQLVEAVDAVERSRGYEPPVFIDVRFSRGVRATGFRASSFARQVGPERYRWIQDLGNPGVQSGGRIRVKNPGAAQTLLDIARAEVKNNRRVIFFCACQYPKVGGNVWCHRVLVGDFVMRAARRQCLSAEVIEWPGHASTGLPISVSPSAAVFRKLRQGQKSIPLAPPIDLAQMGAIPWYTLVDVRPDPPGTMSSLRLLTGPVHRKATGWYLPVLRTSLSGSSSQTVGKLIKRLRAESGR